MQGVSQNFSGVAQPIPNTHTDTCKGTPQGKVFFNTAEGQGVEVLFIKDQKQTSKCTQHMSYKWLYVINILSLEDPNSMAPEWCKQKRVQILTTTQPSVAREIQSTKRVIISRDEGWLKALRCRLLSSDTN